MKKFVTAMCAASLAFGIAACSGETANGSAEATASGSLAGTWKANLDSAEFENDTSSFAFADGTYTCNSCIPPFSVAANGDWVTVDRPGVDALKYTIVDDRTVTTASRLGDKELGTSTWTVSEDGQTLTMNWTDFDGDEEVKGSTTYTRVAAAPEGAHAVSGDWNVASLGEMSDAALTFTYAIDGDTITSTGNSGGYTATLGGEPVTPEGDTTGGTMAVEKVSDNVYRETYSRDGEVISVLELTVDGDTLRGVSTDPRDNSVVRWTATRQ
ncbi:hypothetical protein [Erythrobacter dokdonensis]|uniref:Lipocalin-like domain-containing protein n=1 Tax=Erythrobacter dokdonensis DSW-74 TaxID=1300349 RepID=A0A1A7BFX1_9SPHN|nr:hypothetical protein [Erythrobacter dokdonensis]OBV10120.1 hypothetical protein I603_2681 [Erythrobacter dokdonensis DSW-74]